MRLLHQRRLACILSTGALGFGCLCSGSALAAFPDDNASGTFSIAPPYRLPDFTSAGSGCNDGDTVVIRNGQWSCVSPTPTSAGVETWFANGYGDAPANFEPVPGASLTLPPGAYLILFSGYAFDAEDLGGIPGSGNGDVSTYCVLVDNAGRGVGAPDIATFVDAAKTPISGSVVVQSTDRTPTFHLECSGNQDYVQVYMTAIKVGVMH